MTAALLTLLVLAQQPAGEGTDARDAGMAYEASPLDVQSAASPSVTIDAEAGTDVLAANSVNTDPGSGQPPELTAVELGVRALVHATAFSRHAHLDLDYQGRQPIAGNTRDTPLHLLYQAELSIDLLNKLLYFGIGRFHAPSAVYLPVDGLRAQLHVSKVVLQVFGGRRAVTTSRGNVDFGTFLPAAGASVSLALSAVTAEVAFTYSKDQVTLAADTKTFDAASAYLRASVRPTDWLVLGGELATAQRASYLLGPTWSTVDLRVRSVDLFYGLAFLELKPARSLRISYTFHFQQAELFREGVRLDPADPQITADAFTPRFIDNRVRVRWRPAELGWLGPEARFRSRPEWNELRLGGFIDLAPAWALGICLRGSVAYEKMVPRWSQVLPPPDRSYWSASLGWRWRGLDIAAGASNVQRSAQPLSSRTYTGTTDGVVAPIDLSPFVLEAQRIAFVRAFYGSDLFFVGLDFEQSLTDSRERRFFAQLGARLEKEW